MSEPAPLTLAELQRARDRLRGRVRAMPLIPLELDGAPCEIHLKLENLQPIGSFKLRGAANALAEALEADPGALDGGVVTASAGNMAQGVAWCARELGVPCSVVVPDHAPRAKLEAIERLGARWTAVTFARWWQTLEERGYPGLEGRFVHPVSDRAVMAGNGTIGLELAEQLPDLDAVVVPYGGGGLTTGIASALRSLQPTARVFACEVETAAPLGAALAAGHPVPIDYRPSFVDGIGGRGLLEEMWPLVSRLVHGALAVSLQEIAQAVALLATRTHVVAEGAGAASVAAALGGGAGSGKVVCVVSGGNLDLDRLATILRGGTP